MKKMVGAAMRRELRKTLGSRTGRRMSTKVKEGSFTKGTGKGDSHPRHRRQRPVARLNELINHLPD